MPYVYTYRQGNRPRGSWFGSLITGLVFSLVGLVLRFLMRRLFNVSVQRKPQQSGPEPGFQQATRQNEPAKTESKQPVEDAEWRPV